METQLPVVGSKYVPEKQLKQLVEAEPEQDSQASGVVAGETGAKQAEHL